MRHAFFIFLTFFNSVHSMQSDAPFSFCMVPASTMRTIVLATAGGIAVGGTVGFFLGRRSARHSVLCAPSSLAGGHALLSGSGQRSDDGESEESMGLVGPERKIDLDLAAKSFQAGWLTAVRELTIRHAQELIAQQQVAAHAQAIAETATTRADASQQLFSLMAQKVSVDRERRAALETKLAALESTETLSHDKD